MGSRGAGCHSAVGFIFCAAVSIEVERVLCVERALLRFVLDVRVGFVLREKNAGCVREFCVNGQGKDMVVPACADVRSTSNWWTF